MKEEVTVADLSMMETIINQKVFYQYSIIMFNLYYSLLTIVRNKKKFNLFVNNLCAYTFFNYI